MDPLGITFLLFAGIAALVLPTILVFFMRFVGKERIKSRIEDLLKAGQFKKALQLALLYVKDKTPDFFVLYYMGRCYEGLHQQHKAIEYYEKTILLNGENRNPSFVGEINQKLGDLYFSIDDNEGALAYYKKVLSRPGGHAATLLNAAEIYYRKRNYLTARDYLIKYNGIKTDNPRARYLLAAIYYDLRQFQKSVEQLDRLFRPGADPYHFFGFEAHVLMVKNYAKQKNFDGIIRFLEPLLSRKEHLEDVMPYLIGAYSNRGFYMKIEKLLSDYLTYLPVEVRPGLLCEAAGYLFEGREYYGAIGLWKQALAIDQRSRAGDLIRRYRLLVNNPALENIFTRDDGRAGMFLSKIFGVDDNGIAVNAGEYAIIRDGGTCHVVNKTPSPLFLNRLQEIEDVLKNENVLNFSIVLYSLFGVDISCEGAFFYRRVSLVSGEDFAAFFNKNT